MIYQLPNGRIIHMTLEQYLDLTDEELHELASLGDNFTSEVNDPFFQSVLKGNSKSKADKIVYKTNESEPGLDEVADADKLNDEYFHRDDT
jgi:RNAse (barnase) inhibitor barstar